MPSKPFDAAVAALIPDTGTATGAAIAEALHAALDSPALTGTPTAPTPSTGDSSTKVATTAFAAGVGAAIKALQPVFVDDYGAVGDGVTDDTTAIAAAFTAARASKVAVNFGIGKTYRTSASLDPTGLLVAGNGATLKIKDGTTPTYSSVLAPTAACTIDNLIIDLNSGSTTDPGGNTQGAGIYFYNAAGWSGQAVIRNVTVKNGYQCGIRIGTNASITDALNAPASRVSIENVVISSVKYGIWNLAVSGVTIKSPAISGCAQTGIYDYLTLDTQIIGGSVLSTVSHGVLSQYSNGFSCQGVTVKNSSAIGICMGGGSTTNVPSCNFTIIGNRVYKCASSGISVDLTVSGAETTPVPSYSVVANNVCRENTVHGIYLHNAQYVACSGNTCYKNGNEGISADSLNLTIAANVLIGNLYGMGLHGLVAGYGSHQIGRNVTTGNTTSDYAFDTHGADGTGLDLSGTGSPNSVVTAPVGSRYMQTNGGAGTTLWVKESGAGNTGWVGK